MLTESKHCEVVYSCAFYFPGVLLTAGDKEWSILKVAYNNLLKSKENTVKVTILLSIHEVAKVLGPKLTTEKLDSIVKSHLTKQPTTKLCLTRLHEFLPVLNESQRRNYLELIKSIITLSGHQWRIRIILAEHAGDYAKLFNTQLVYKYIFPIICDLVQDKVGEVRVAACKEFTKVLSRLKADEDHFNKAIDFVHKLAVSTSFRGRQSFLLICEKLMNSKELFEEHFLTEFLRLQKDKVPNVRITLAKVLRSYINNSGENLYITRTIEALKEDESRDVRENIGGVIKETSKPKVSPEVLEKEQEMAAETLESATSKDEEIREEIRRQENKKLIKSTFKIDEIE